MARPTEASCLARARQSARASATLEEEEMKSMRKLVVGTFTTLDGVMQAPGGPNEDRAGGFQHSGWLVPYFDAKFGEIMTEWTKRAGAFLLGRKTYEIFADSWPKSTDPAHENGMALNTGRSSSHPGHSIRSTGTTPSCSRATLPRRLRSARHGRRRDSGPRQRQPHPNHTSARSRRYRMYLAVSCRSRYR